MVDLERKAIEVQKVTAAYRMRVRSAASYWLDQQKGVIEGTWEDEILTQREIAERYDIDYRALTHAVENAYRKARRDNGTEPDTGD